jgi:hypothetical protein
MFKMWVHRWDCEAVIIDDDPELTNELAVKDELEDRCDPL